MNRLKLKAGIFAICIGLVVGHLLGPLPPSVSAFSTQNLQSNLIWTNIKELSTVIGGLVAVFTYFRNSNSRREDVALQKFSNTIAAENYFHHEFALTIDKSIAQYETLLVHNGYFITENEIIKNAAVQQTVQSINFSQYFKTLNRLAAYPYYHEVNDKQLYSSIADDIQKLTDIKGFTIVQQMFSENHTMNNYQTMIADALHYLELVNERRARHD
ncbi:hypothetical protein [Loigolactobacillus bifermentans]|uniref:Uncharacterized protein n=1 Tax=Loigolactobacillus bifermentans DSM 20003 TaxID=1423726 RepID=A0A0R1GLT0_9LACO|nr:hypothetical protein [Loigolactobacillus bifermentans]KRK34971.1 hypothetical protein FC07_GL000322 [Loigolactobacillus bifermentans DSM 20003]QGG61332.1 hypothetical protein LB003_13115 [Loigolactobacillus bifermentans]